MKRNFCSALLTGFFVLSFGVAIATCSEKPVKFKDLPPAVQKTATTESRGAIVKGYSKEIEKGKIEYEVQLVVDGKSRDVSMDASGKVIETEQEVGLDAVPDKARDAIKKAASSGKIVKVEAVKGDGPTVYEAQVRNNGKKYEVRVNENGDPAPED